MCYYGVFPLVALACVKELLGRLYSERQRELGLPYQCLATRQPKRMRGLGNVHEGLEKANIQREEYRTQDRGCLKSKVPTRDHSVVIVTYHPNSGLTLSYLRQSE